MRRVTSHVGRSDAIHGRRRAALAGVLIAGVLALGALPASADAAVYHIVNVDGWRCLDNNESGDLYVSKCTDHPNQSWKIWQNGWTKSVGTNQCLTRWSPPETWDCREHDSQYWYHWEWGWYKNWDWWFVRSRCLSRTPGHPDDVSLVPCLDPNNPPLRERWYTVRVG